MDDNSKENSQIDPDYEDYNSALEHQKEEDKKENMKKLQQIIDEEFTKEISTRQEQIEQIENQIFKARKLLHLLRYVLISSYYKKKELEYVADEEPSTSNGYVEFDKQNRLHPALKKLLGGSVQNLDQIQLKDKRKTVTRTPFTTLGKKAELKVIPAKKTPVPQPPPQLVSIKNRTKTKHRLIIGNTSQYITESGGENLTHKWLVYLRGPKEKPNVSSIVDKVVFYLHPSYRPYDVVEICESPFRLARRGWGEFPIRVKIFFKFALNKPIDVVHNIVLDKTYTGRQMLGKETLIDVFLYDDSNGLEESEQEPALKRPKLEMSVKEEPTSENESYPEINSNTESILTDIKQEIDIFESINLEHDYSTESSDNKQIKLEHSYPSLSADLFSFEKEKIVQDEGNYLIFGLDRVYAEKYKLLHKNKTISSSPTIGSSINNHSFVIPKNKFKNMGEALMYTFKIVKICSQLALDSNYKRVCHFTAASLREFVGWNTGKRRSSEWSRALFVRRLLQAANVHGVGNWSTKSILMFGRSHGFTPYISYGLFARNSLEKQLLLDCYRNSSDLVEHYVPKMVEDTATIDVDTEIDYSSKLKKSEMVDISEPSLSIPCTFVHDTALECGIILRNEEIDEGVVFNGAERMILEAVKSLAENLIRRAKNRQICNNPLQANSVISKECIEKVLVERKEMNSLARFKEERKNWEFLH